MYHISLCRASCVLLIMCLSVVICGCGSAAEKPEFASKLVPVTGTVTLNDQPLAGVMVIYQPAKGQAEGENAFGVTDESGKYTLHTSMVGQSMEDSQGAVPGQYKVFIQKLVLPDGSPVGEDITDAEAEEKGARQLLPPKYSSLEETQLTATVGPADTTNDFNLKD